MRNVYKSTVRFKGKKRLIKIKYLLYTVNIYRSFFDINSAILLKRNLFSLSPVSYEVNLFWTC